MLKLLIEERQLRSAPIAARQFHCGSINSQQLKISNYMNRLLEVAVARTSWFDDKAEHPAIQERVSQLQTFTDALADGMVTKQELAGQEQRLVAAMKKVEPSLSDDLHAKVTDVLVELTA